MNHSAEISQLKHRIAELEARLPVIEEKPVAVQLKPDALERDAFGAVVLQDGIASYEDRRVAERQEWERQVAYEKRLSREGVPPGFYRDLNLGGIIRRVSDNCAATAAELAQAQLEAAKMEAN